MISTNCLLTVYCLLVLLASLAGGWLLLVIRPTHARLQIATSLVAGLMLGIALLHFLPDAAGQCIRLTARQRGCWADSWPCFSCNVFSTFITTTRPRATRTTIVTGTTNRANPATPMLWRTNQHNNFPGSARRWD